MIKHYPTPPAPTTRYRHLSLEDFEEAGVRVVEIRFEIGRAPMRDRL
jgi:hypothetical protein